MYGFTLGFKSKCQKELFQMSCSRWARASCPRVSLGPSDGSSTRSYHQKCTGYLYREKLVLKENLLFFFFFLIDFGNLNFHQCKYKSLYPALRLIGTIFSLYVLSLCHILSHPGLWVKDPVNWLSSSRSSTSRPGKLEKGIVEEAKVDPHQSPLLHLWACERRHLTLCTSYLCFRGREKAIRTNNGRGAWTQTSRKKPFSQVLLSASHHP